MIRSRKFGFLAVGVSVLVAVCAGAAAAADHQGSVNRQSISALGPWGAAKHVVSVDDLYFSGQPDAAGFAQAAAHGVTVVVNIRGADEVDWDVAGAAQAAGLSYYNEPLIITPSGLDGPSVERINRLVRQFDGEHVLVHCASGNRVAAWWATHLAADHEMNAHLALELARTAGMTSAKLDEMVEAYLH